MHKCTLIQSHLERKHRLTSGPRASCQSWFQLQRDVRIIKCDLSQRAGADAGGVAAPGTL